MRIVFFGSSEFALRPLAALVDGGFAPLCVVTQPDKHKARGMGLAGTAVKDEALRLGIEIFQPENINETVSIQFLKSLNADLFVVAAYGRMLSNEILSVPKIMPVNLHPSLLPKYRGAAPLNWVLINGEKSTGVSVVRMVKKMDAGPVLLSLAGDIQEEDDAVTLGKRLSDKGADLLVEAVRRLEKGVLDGIPQNDGEATFAPLLKKDDGRIEWDKTASSIHNLVRGCAGWPGTFTYFRGRILKIKETGITGFLPAGSSPGEISLVSDKGLQIACKEGSLLVKRLQPESKKEMTAQEFINGYNPLPGEYFTPYQKKVDKP